MKKLLVWMSIGVLAFGMAGCGGKGADDNKAPTEESAAPTDTPAPEEEPTQEPQDVPVAGGDHDYAEGWTEEMDAVKKAVTDLLGENYFPNMPLDPDMLEQLVGVTPDIYEDYLAEIPMISTNVDTLIVVKAAGGQADAVEEALNAYRNVQVGNTMQYPQNVGKIQASKVGRVGDYVIFTLLGGDVSDLLDQGDEVVITHCQEINDSVIKAIGEVLQ